MNRRAAILVAALLGVSEIAAQCQTTSSLSWKFQPSVKDGSLKPTVIANGLQKPRGIRWANNTLLIIDSGVGLLALVEGGNGTCDGGWTKSVLVNNPEFNHGLAVRGNSIYATTVENLFRYTWNPQTRDVSQAETLIRGMNLADNHKTRTIEVTGQFVYISGGSSTNLEAESADPAHGTAQVRRFPLNGTIPSGGYDWFQGELVAYGMRNAVGMSLSEDESKLWTVENSADELNYTTSSGLVDIHKDNPSEELNEIDLNSIGHSYGYPNCFTAWDMSVVSGSNLHTGDQFSISSSITDSQCQNDTFNQSPKLSMMAHSAPLDIRFYNADSANDTVSVSKDWNHDAFVSFHGSWNREPPTGYGINSVEWQQAGWKQGLKGWIQFYSSGTGLERVS
ncbi:hypothetical protein FRC17_000856 [Serendipita sp. 399]|nr:hypothetical protein FRC17_000856 [Serendipita sp. 399]